MFKYEISKESGIKIAKVNVKDYLNPPLIEEDPLIMAFSIDLILKEGVLNKIVFIQNQEYEYDEEQLKYLQEIAELIKYLVYTKKILSIPRTKECLNSLIKKYEVLKNILFYDLKKDPIGTYVEIKRIIRQEELLNQSFSICPIISQWFVERLNVILNALEKTKIISLFKDKLEGFRKGQRVFYRELFHPIIKPTFVYIKLALEPPERSKEIDYYKIDKDSEVIVYYLEDKVYNYYQLIPPEYKLSEDEYIILDVAKKILSEHKPNKLDFMDIERTREVFKNIAFGLVDDVSNTYGVNLSSNALEKLSEILVRNTIGFGILEVLLKDQKVLDLSINPPNGEVPIFIDHSEWDYCITNIIPNYEEIDSWASKFRLYSGRPLDESNPVLDTELVLPNSRARVAIVTKPLSPWGYGLSIRRHRDKPWTLPLLIKNRTLSSFSAGLLSFLIDGNKAFLIAGTRGSGKTSLLSALMIEIMRSYRILTVEDTLELPTEYLRKLGYNIQPLKVRSALSHMSTEMPADEGLRVSLRLGDSVLIVGEVRSTEAKALFEAMRIGAASNVVGGTIHGDSPYGVFDRVVNDLGVPRTSFKAVDLIIIQNPIRSPDGLRRYRRTLQITEVRKHWENDPLEERGFIDLMKYNAEKDLLEPTSDLINGDSEVLKSVAAKVKGLVGRWDKVWENIELRAEIKQMLVDYSYKVGNWILEADFVVLANDKFHKISEKIGEEFGEVVKEEVLKRFESWLKEEIKKSI